MQSVVFEKGFVHINHLPIQHMQNISVSKSVIYSAILTVSYGSQFDIQVMLINHMAMNKRDMHCKTVITLLF